ncbi:MAG: carbohydrate-binding domain-containing protein [Oscillospiraceae bacterium]|nr:carbohydrate-binding domain-containing protein [Oscillospiraceae bacterium]
MKRTQKWLPAALALLLLLSACGQSGGTTTDSSAATDSSATSDSSTSDTASDSSTSSEGAEAVIDTAEMFTDRDYETDYDAGSTVAITLNGDSASCDSSAVTISGSTVTITDEGVYLLSGTLSDGMIVVEATNQDKVQLVLNGVSINSETSAAIYVLQADKVFITTAAGTENTLTNGGEFVAIDENNIDAVIFSKDDLTLNGEGTLTIESPAGHGVVTKDDLVVTCGAYDISCASQALNGKQSVRIAGGTFTLTAGKDGIHAEDDDDASLGYVYILDGDFTIEAEGDGISAGNCLQIDGGTFAITAGGGSANGSQSSSSYYGQFGGRSGMMGGASTGTTTDTTTDSTSMKGVKATYSIAINGGSFTIDSADDAVHSNASITVTGGTFAIATGDDGFHADETLSVQGGTITITESYEGLEALDLEISGGEITLTASDDGLNAAGGTDSSGNDGRDTMFGGGGFGTSSSNGTVVISGGTLYIQASGDGIDANGSLLISGGYTVVCGPTTGDTATLDYDTTATITGGTFIGTGAYSMAQTFSDCQQGVVAVSVGSQSAGTTITLTDADGNEIFNYTPELDFAVVILSSADIVSGESYTIAVGSETGDVTAS